jgi:hypothetical protein
MIEDIMSSDPIVSDTSVIDNLVIVALNTNSMISNTIRVNAEWEKIKLIKFSQFPLASFHVAKSKCCFSTKILYYQ